MKIKILRKFLYLWDVFFTLIDIYQLKLYYKLRKFTDNLELRSKMSKKLTPKIGDITPLTGWDEVKND